MKLQDEWTSLPAPWQRCFELMWEAYSADTIPVGAVLVNGGGEIVSTGRNRVYEPAENSQGGQLLSHAEFNLLSALDPNQRYEDHTVYGSLEPCLLCVVATAMATVGTLRFAGADPYAGASSLAFTNPHIDRLGFTMRVRGTMHSDGSQQASISSSFSDGTPRVMWCGYIGSASPRRYISRSRSTTPICSVDPKI